MDNHLKNIRRRVGLTQEELAEQLGVSRQAIIALENGRNLPSIPLAINIAQFFQLPVEVIFHCQKENNQKKGDPMDKEIMPWSPWREMASMREALDRMFDEGVTTLTRNSDWQYPAINVRQTENNILIEADVPGMKQEDIDIEISDNMVTIAGERKASHEEKGANYFHKEVSFGSFRRSINLPVDVRGDKASADIVDGTLVVKLPKAEPEKPKTIKLKPGQKK
ncbi:MAG TPA: Hsp20 family protein [bacterium]|nr:Hsp20 family protein [bacterium]HOR57216.1 Hsp20 family protein [bacterium]HPL56046.1 Hsp20 family protein [bacterium]